MKRRETHKKRRREEREREEEERRAREERAAREEKRRYLQTACGESPLLLWDLSDVQTDSSLFSGP
jgi:hypothetical protein